jgi:hypothetical protein
MKVDLYAGNQKIGSGTIEGDTITAFTPTDGGPKLEGRLIQITAMEGSNKGQSWTTRAIIPTEAIRLKDGCPFQCI